MNELNIISEGSTVDNEYLMNTCHYFYTNDFNVSTLIYSILEDQDQLSKSNPAHWTQTIASKAQKLLGIINKKFKR